MLECCCCRQNQFNSADKPDYPIPCLSLSSALSISSAFLWFWGEIAKMTRHAHRDWQPYCSAVFFWGGGEGRLCRSDLTVSVRRVNTLRSFYTEETHSTEEGYPDRLTGYPPSKLLIDRVTPSKLLIDSCRLVSQSETRAC